MKRYLIIASVFIVGIFLIYLAGSNLIVNEPTQEILFENEQQGQDTKGAEENILLFSKAPGFESKDVNGNKAGSSVFINKAAVLIFWTTWNPAAQDQLKIFDSYYQTVKDNNNLALLAINNQEDSSIVSNFIRRGEYNLPILLDEKGEIGELYKISTLPVAYFINNKGEVNEIYVGILKEEEIRDRVKKLLE